MALNGNEQSAANSSQLTDISSLNLSSASSQDLSLSQSLDAFDEIFMHEPAANRQKRWRCKFCDSNWTTNRYFRLNKHVKTCTSIPNELSSRYELSLNSQESSMKSKHNHRLNRLFGMVMIKANLSLALLEDSLFKTFVKTACPTWKPATREEMSSVFFPNISEDIDARLMRAISDSQDYSISIEFDHWSDINGQSQLGVAFTFNDGKCYLKSLENVVKVGHSSAAIMDTLRRALKDVPKLKINAIISDYAASCRSARDRLTIELDYIHVVSLRCIAHLLNLISNEFGKSVSPVIESANSLSSSLRNNSRLCLKLKERGLRKPKKPVCTRWYSNVTTLEILLSNREALEELSIEGVISNASDLVMIQDSEFWNSSKDVVNVMRPLANCIAQAEKADGSLGEAFASVLEYAKSISTLPDDQEINFAIAQALSLYFGPDKLAEEELHLMLAAYFLDRRYCMNYVTKKGRIVVSRVVFNLAIASGVFSNAESQTLYSNFRDFCSQKGPLSRKASREESALEWWSEQSNLIALKVIGIRLANLRSSSANLERVWSSLRYVQQPASTNYDQDTLICIMRTKTYLQDRSSVFDQLDYELSVEPRPKRNNKRRGKQNPTSIDCNRSIEAEQSEKSQEDTNYITRNICINFSDLIDFSIINKMEEEAYTLNEGTIDELVMKFADEDATT